MLVLTSKYRLYPEKLSLIVLEGLRENREVYFGGDLGGGRYGCTTESLGRSFSLDSMDSLEVMSRSLEL